MIRAHNYDWILVLLARLLSITVGRIVLLEGIKRLSTGLSVTSSEPLIGVVRYVNWLESGGRYAEQRGWSGQEAARGRALRYLDAVICRVAENTG